MAEYIDRNEIPAPYYAEEYDEYVVGIGEINSIPTADVQEVKHGQWIDDIKEIFPLNGNIPLKALVGYRCSVCNRPEFLKEPYCNCGAKMDERS